MRVIEFSATPEIPVTRDDIIGEQFNKPIVSAESTQTKKLVADLIRFPAGFNHQLHRHFDGDQITIVTEGEIIAYDDKREQVVAAGSAVLFPSREWHGVRCEVEATVINLFPGVGAIPDAGYEKSDPPVSGGPS
jgi:quercetin dioxygenase-like cupin family protein